MSTTSEGASASSANPLDILALSPTMLTGEAGLFFLVNLFESSLMSALAVQIRKATKWATVQLRYQETVPLRLPTLLANHLFVRGKVLYLPSLTS